MLIGLHHVGRVVHNLDRAARQLHAVSGWPVTTLAARDDPLVAGRDVHATARAEGPNGWIELVGVEAEAGRRREVNEPGVTHAGIQTGGIQGVIERASQAGFDCDPNPIDLGTGFQYVYVRNPSRRSSKSRARHTPHSNSSPGWSMGRSLHRMSTAFARNTRISSVRPPRTRRVSPDTASSIGCPLCTTSMSPALGCRSPTPRSKSGSFIILRQRPARGRTMRPPDRATSPSRSTISPPT